MKYLSVCSGIEAATVAWHGLGWTPAAFSEIEPFPSAVLAHHWPDVQNLGDLTQHGNWPSLRPDLIVGGTPCQAFSVAGLRKGLEDPRGNLTLVFLGLLARERPRWVVWENVPGVLSDKTGAFGAFLGGLGELGYGFAYRVLDAQYFGVAQRRRRVFVVGYLGDWRRAAAVLFEPDCLSGNPPPSREAGKISPTIPARSLGGGGLGTDFDCDGRLIAHSLRGEGFDASEDGTGRGTPIVPVAFSGRARGDDGRGYDREPQIFSHGITGPIDTVKPHCVAFSCKDYGSDAGQVSPTLRSMGHDGSHTNGGGQVAIALERRMVRTSGGQPQEELNHCLRSDTNTGDGAPCVAYRTSGNCGAWETGDKTDALTTGTDPFNHVLRQTAAVRRLTPRECERLQGFPDDHTLIPWRNKPADECPDGPRYKALGNSMAVPVMRWIGERIQSIDSL